MDNTITSRTLSNSDLPQDIDREMDGSTASRALVISELSGEMNAEIHDTAASRAFGILELPKHRRADTDASAASPAPVTADLTRNINSEMLTTAVSSVLGTPQQTRDIWPELEDTAVSQVLNTTELLENILIRGLSTAEVTRARQVNRFFQAVIDNSRPLRRVMFLEPEPVHETIDHYHRPSNSAKPLAVSKLHPALSPLCRPKRNRLGLPRHPEVFDFRSPAEPWLPGMWRSMLICQPPCATTRAEFRVYRPHGPNGGGTFICTMFEGDTLGALVDTAVSLRAEPGAQVTLSRLLFHGHADADSAFVKESRAKAERDAAQTAKAEADKVKESENGDGEIAGQDDSAGETE